MLLELSNGKILKRALFLSLLLFCGMSFAAWEASGIALGLSAVVLACIYMVAIGFNVPELKAVAKEEMFQLVATLVMIVIFIGSNSLLDAISHNADLLEPGTTTIQQSASVSLGNTFRDTSGLFRKIATYDQRASAEASKGMNCQVVGIGYSVSGCGGFSALAVPLSMTGGIIGFALGELGGMAKLVQVMPVFVLLLLPLGILLRTFKFSRGAGGLLIAAAISIQILLPIGIIFTDMLAAKFAASPAEFAGYTRSPSATVVSVDTCSPGSTSGANWNVDSNQPPANWREGGLFGSSNWLDGGSNEQKAAKVYTQMRAEVRSTLYLVMIKATIGPILALLMVMGGIRAIAALAGSDVDVSVLGRFA